VVFLYDPTPFQASAVFAPDSAVGANGSTDFQDLFLAGREDRGRTDLLQPAYQGILAGDLAAQSCELPGSAQTFAAFDVA
jgi:hypothetical protein